MKVSAWSNGKNQYGIRVGKPNRREYFDPRWEAITVTVNGVAHRFALTKGFWKDCPEFRDKGQPVIGQWLASQDLLNWPRGKPPKLVLSHIEDNCFELCLA
ncbi:hypothetical protein RO22_18030 [Halomonas sp. KHS3]|nr:hypothetical protein RO22_18030 [Halomonas sp. KHS3]SDI52549.1 hypothetical protein SAMN04487867_10889 [Halomonas titanicae]